MASQPSPVDDHLVRLGSPFCSNPDCPHCRELRATAELAQAGKDFRLILVKPGRNRDSAE